MRRGRDASKPTEIPKRGWLDIFWRVKAEAQKDAVAFYSAGVSFYLLLALVPAMAAIVGVYGLVADGSSVAEHLQLLDGLLPPDIIDLLKVELVELAKSNKAAGWALFTGLILAMWGASKAIEALTIALNNVYDETETRGLIKRKVNSLMLTAGMIVYCAALLALMLAAPAVIAFAGLGSLSDTLIGILRWPLLLVAAFCAINALYRYAPSRANPKLKWSAPGSIFATLAWVGICVGLTLYATHLGGTAKTYGSFAAIVLLMLFFYLSSLAILIGGEINAEAEHQTTVDSTTGKPKPMGERGAFVADHIGEKRENLE